MRTPRPSGLLWAIGMALMLSGCQTVRYRTALPASGVKFEKNLDYFALGLIGSHEIELEPICPHGIHAWRTEAPLYGLLDFLTVGIYTPRTLVVECAEAPK